MTLAWRLWSTEVCAMKGHEEQKPCYFIKNLKLKTISGPRLHEISGIWKMILVGAQQYSDFNIKIKYRLHHWALIVVFDPQETRARSFLILNAAIVASSFCTAGSIWMNNPSIFTRPKYPWSCHQDLPTNFSLGLMNRFRDSIYVIFFMYDSSCSEVPSENVVR